MKRQRYLCMGRTTLELMGVLAILGSEAVGVYGMASNVVAERRLVDTLLKLPNLAATVQDAFAWTDSYVVSNTGSDDGNIYKGTTYTSIQGYLEGEKVLTSKDLTLSYGPTVTVGSSSGEPRYFTLSVDADKYLCRAMAREDWGTMLKSIKIGSTEKQYANTPLNLSDASSACGTSGATVILKFR